jgi:nitrate/nitrite-specific signal transduction histidine kinase
VELAVEDDGVGMHRNGVKGTGFGGRIVAAMAKSLKSSVTYPPVARGTRAEMVFGV